MGTNTGLETFGPTFRRGRETRAEQAEQVRLRQGRAKRLMLEGGESASTVAKAVGYESASQLSREFKRQFGVPPMEHVERLRQVLTF